MNFDFRSLSEGCQSGAIAQEWSIRKEMWDKIQMLEKRVDLLQSQVDEMRSKGVNI